MKQIGLATLQQISVRFVTLVTKKKAARKSAATAGLFFRQTRQRLTDGCRIAAGS